MLICTYKKIFFMYPFYFESRGPTSQGRVASVLDFGFGNTKGWNIVCYLLIDWLYSLLGIYVALAVFQPYRDLEAGDNQSLKFKWRGRQSNPGPLAPQVKSLTTRPPPLLVRTKGKINVDFSNWFFPFVWQQITFQPFDNMWPSWRYRGSRYPCRHKQGM